MGTPFKMKGSAFYGKGNQSPVSQIGSVPKSATPPPGWRAERQAPSAPAAPSAASLDYVNPVESPASQVRAKQEVGQAGQVAINKAEMKAKRAQGPIEQRAPRTREPQASQMDWVNPVEGSSPASQISAQSAKERATANINKTEAIAARGSGPIEQKKSKKKLKIETPPTAMDTLAAYFYQSHRPGSDDPEFRKSHVKLKGHKVTDKEMKSASKTVAKEAEKKKMEL